MCGIILICTFNLLIPFSCVAIYSPGSEVTKPPLQWVGFPWPRRTQHGRHAWLSESDDNINIGTIDHVKHAESHTQNNQEQQQSEVKWEIVPDPTRTGGFKMVRTSEDEQEDIPSEELDFNSPGFAQGQQQQTEILASGITRGNDGMKDGHIIQHSSLETLDNTGQETSTINSQHPSLDFISNGMSHNDSIKQYFSTQNSQYPSLDAIVSGMSFGDNTIQEFSAQSNQYPSLNILSSGMSFGNSTGQELSAQSNQYPSLDILSSGMSYGENSKNGVSALTNHHPSQDILASGMSYGNVGRETPIVDHFNTQPSSLGHESAPVQSPALWNHQLEIETFNIYDKGNTQDEMQKFDSDYSVVPARREAAASSSALLKATCPAGATGQFVYIQDCRRFLNCWKGRGFIQACAPGTLFNPDTQECDFPMKVKCLNASHISNRREGRILSNTGTPVVNPSPQQQKVSECPMPGGTGLAPHPTDCAKFLNCWNGAPHIQDCAPGTLFNAQTLVCDFPYNVICKPVSNSLHAEGTAEILEGPLEKYEEPSEPRRSYCTMEGGSGMAPHPTDCSKYISCWKGVAHTQSCGPGTLFNPLTLHCDFPQNVNCTALQNIGGNAPGKPSPNKPILPSIIPTTTRRTTARPIKTTTTTASSSTRATTTTTTVPSTTIMSITLPPPSSGGLEGVVGSGQKLRLRGGPSPWEGYVEIQGSIPGWGLVCDETNKWTILEANVVCQQLGYERGAEMSWQGRPIQSTEDTQKIAVGKVSCIGTESSLSSCQLIESSHCIIARDAVGVRCYRNWLSQCRPNELNHRGHCYELVVPHEHHSTLGFTHAEAMEDCQSRGGHLLDINSQEENDFISEWLIQLQPNITNILTAGVGVSITRRTIWIWEGSNAPIAFNRWWPGWTGEHGEAPVIGQRPLCIIAKRVFPCELAYYTSQPVSDIHSHHHDENKRLCAVNYFYWDTEDCSITHSHPYICERPVDDIGCLPKSGRMYLGFANVTVSGSACLPWDDPSVVPKLGYRVSRRERLANLTGHNHCRYIGSSSQPWCYIDKQGKKEDCDIPPCWSNVLEKTVSLTVYSCGTNEYECKPGECIPNKWKCNGQKDCSNGYDEQDCWAEMLNQFSKYTNHRIKGHIREKWMRTNVETCARYCIESKGFTCRSFSHKEEQNECLLSDSNIGLSGSVVQVNGWQYFEVIAHSILCKNSNRFECDNGKCINISQVCNGKNECGDKSDEKNCSAEYLGYAIRLAGSNVSNEGRLEVKVFGKWGVICDDLFAMRNAEVACRELGFHLGAVEVLPPGSYGTRGILPFLMDDLRCTGNETTLRHCDFQGWGVHDCLPDEAVSIVCSVPGQTCPLNKWQCRISKECIPVMYLCDNIDDCDDASDEDPDQCNQAVEIRLSGGSSSMEGRVEVKYHGLWGTVCDDDFSAAAARVICRSLGFGGPAEALKDAAFGPGEGQIWLDQLHCSGNETSIIQCLHPPWGEHNCQHNEDASVLCSHENTRHSDISHTMEIAPESNEVIQMSSILPGQCGKRSTPEVEYEHVARVVGGNEVPEGSYPWQASIRVRNGQKSVHWCGAVVLSPLHILTAGHCMVDYTKSMYFVRVGDHDTEEVEEFEQELNIDQIYMHEQFNKGVRLNNDIALVKLKGLGIQLGDTVQPVCLPEAGITYSASLNCTVSGWGSLKAAGSGYSRRLRAAWLPILPSETCTAGYVYGNNSIGEGMFCAGQLEGGVDSCQGDSGGPFVCFVNDEFVLYGITSWGHGCGRANKPGVYTNVSYYKEWINQKLKDSMTGH